MKIATTDGNASLRDRDSVDESEVRQLAGSVVSAQQALRTVLEKLVKRQCPLSSLPAAQCHLCVRQHPNHYPHGLTRQVREILGRYEDILKLFEERAAVPDDS